MGSWRQWCTGVSLHGREPRVHPNCMPSHGAGSRISAMVGMFTPQQSENTSNPGSPCLREPIAKYWPSGTTGSSGQGWWWEDQLGTGTQQKWGGGGPGWWHWGWRKGGECMSVYQLVKGRQTQRCQIFLSTSHDQVEDAERTDCMSAKTISPTTAHPQLWGCGRIVPDDTGQQSWRYRAFRSPSKTLPRNCSVNVTFQVRVRASQTLAVSLYGICRLSLPCLGKVPHTSLFLLQLLQYSL